MSGVAPVATILVGRMFQERLTKSFVHPVANHFSWVDRLSGAYEWNNYPFMDGSYNIHYVITRNSTASCRDAQSCSMHFGILLEPCNVDSGKVYFIHAFELWRGRTYVKLLDHTENRIGDKTFRPRRRGIYGILVEPFPKRDLETTKIEFTMGQLIHVTRSKLVDCVQELLLLHSKKMGGNCLAVADHVWYYFRPKSYWYHLFAREQCTTPLKKVSELRAVVQQQRQCVEFGINQRGRLFSFLCAKAPFLVLFLLCCAFGSCFRKTAACVLFQGHQSCGNPNY